MPTVLAWLVACGDDRPGPDGGPDRTDVTDLHTGATTTTPPTEDCPSVEAFTHEPATLLLERRLEVTLDGPADVWIACTSPDDPEERHLLESAGPDDAHSFALRGLLAETTYTCNAHAACGGRAPAVTFTTERPSGVPVLTSTVTAGQTPEGAYTLFNQQPGSCVASPATYVTIVDPDGRLRWLYAVEDPLVLDLDVQVFDHDKVHFGGGWGIFDLDQPNRGVFRDVDLSGEVLIDRELPDFGLGFNHHSERLADGTYLSLTGHTDTDGDETWNGVGVELWSPTDGLVWTWDSGALALAGEVLPPTRIEDLVLPSPYHANAATLLADAHGDALWLSIYGYEALWRIDRATGERTHVFGHDGDFTLRDTTGQRLPASEYPWVQHGPDYKPDGHVLVYDNGVDRPGGGTSRVAEYQLDLDTLEATLLWSWTEPSWYSTVVGDADYLPGGHVLVAQGHSNCAEPRRGETEIVELAPPGTVVARLTWPNDDWALYRAERYDGCAMFDNARYCATLSARWDELVGR